MTAEQRCVQALNILEKTVQQARAVDWRSTIGGSMWEELEDCVKVAYLYARKSELEEVANNTTNHELSVLLEAYLKSTPEGGSQVKRMSLQ